MAKLSKPSFLRPALLIIMLMITTATTAQTQPQLSTNFYDKTCPKALTTIQTSVRSSLAKDKTMSAALIRLYFHDCFVHGCDASLLLNQSQTINTEKTAPPNRSTRGYDVVEAAKAQVEAICPGVVSCADVLAVATKEATVYAGGPSWDVKLGRMDSTSAFPDQVVTSLPFFKADVQMLINDFWRKGLSPRDMVALSGAHTLGGAQCLTFRDRIHSNGSDIDAGFAATKKRQCPAVGANSTLAALDPVTPDRFDNNYFRNLVQRKGLLVTDQALFSGGPTDGIVIEYSRNSSKFSEDFAAAMVKMGDLQPPAGSPGQIRRVCGSVNK